GERMKGILAVRRNRIVVRSGECRRRDTHRLRRAIKRSPIEVALRGVLRRGDEISGAGSLINPGKRDDIDGTVCHRSLLTVAIDTVQMHPAITLGHDKEFRTVPD